MLDQRVCAFYKKETPKSCQKTILLSVVCELACLITQGILEPLLLKANLTVVRDALVS